MALPSVPIRDLQADIISRRPPTSSVFRRYYGKGTDLAAIEAAVRSADVGRMADLTDLEGESLGFDPSMAGILTNKRLGPLSMLPLQFKPAEGEDIDKEKAIDFANVVSRVVGRIPRMSQNVYDLAWGMWTGRAASEVQWTRAAGTELKWVPTELRFIHPRNLSHGPERELRYIDPWNQRAYFTDEGIALRDVPGKFIDWMPRNFNEYPEREGLGPRCLYWTFFKRFSWRMRMLLTEIFGIPWRIVKPASATLNAMVAQANADQLKEAGDAMERLGAETTAVLGNGIEAEVIQPENKGELFGMTSEQVDAQIAKLILGNVGTTDGTKAGLNTNTVGVMKGGEETILQRDARGLGEEYKADLAYYIMLINYGQEAADLYTPKPVLDASPSRDRKTEMDLAERAVKLSVPVAVKQVREIAQLEEPEKGDELVKAPAPPPMPGEDPLDPKEGKDGADGEDGSDGDDEGTKLGKNLWRDTVRALRRET